MSEDSLERVYFDKWTLRQRFNAGDYYGRLRRGELTAVVYNERLAPPRANQPRGTLTQIVRYYDHGVEVARVHQYRLRGDSLGGSGLPDPKWLREGNLIMMQVDSED
jgi:hypothetical protein